MVLCFIHPRLKPPVAFCRQPHLNKPGNPARLCEKKYDPERSAGWRFFFSKPAGPGLEGMSRLIRTLLRKSHWRIERKVKHWYQWLTGSGKKSGCGRRQSAAGQTAAPGLFQSSEAAERQRCGWNCWP